MLVAELLVAFEKVLPSKPAPATSDSNYSRFILCFTWKESIEIFY